METVRETIRSTWSENRKPCQDLKYHYRLGYGRGVCVVAPLGNLQPICHTVSMNLGFVC